MSLRVHLMDRTRTPRRGYSHVDPQLLKGNGPLGALDELSNDAEERAPRREAVRAEEVDGLEREGGEGREEGWGEIELDRVQGEVL